ncbi:MAG: ECF transporter S component [Nitrososphaerota archaeon]|nr:ECF transporter S component [Candidatus Bathyarchaeota archaeon]MCX8161651.1 ECF transporter S component [Candidatus Bathyarchaeota archaeon]MDW8061303.1 ECF transporter S component [Nitrososphaerota archaeon]
MKSRRAYFVAISSISTALVAIATLALQVYIPATRGYFNIGEVMVYTVALIFGPKVGGFAGGVGSALADIISGYGYYAPATLIAKGLEGYIVGYVSRFKLRVSHRSYRILSLAIPLILTLVFWSISSQVYTGLAEVTLLYYALKAEIPTTLWIIVSIALFVSLTVYLFRVGYDSMVKVVAIICGGSIMVLCYYLYQQMVLGVYALVEVPINIGQMLVGLLLSIPLSEALSRIAIRR